MLSFVLYLIVGLVLLIGLYVALKVMIPDNNDIFWWTLMTRAVPSCHNSSRQIIKCLILTSKRETLVSGFHPPLPNSTSLNIFLTWLCDNPTFAANSSSFRSGASISAITTSQRSSRKLQTIGENLLHTSSIATVSWVRIVMCCSFLAAVGPKSCPLSSEVELGSGLRQGSQSFLYLESEVA